MRGFGELEAEIMDYLWSQDGARTVRQIHTALSRHRSSAYTTVSTVVDNLHKKGWLHRDRATRGAFSYVPVASREEYGARLMREALDCSGNRAEALVRFVDGMSAQEAAALRAALQAHEDTTR
ncbi:MAG: BlaI/MecI/CopY family transcriptional regulator [Actinomycetota bacterium]|nr:BlaI/MecI/CopY family transcriptional regulator [Actinomycetota bacterium]